MRRSNGAERDAVHGLTARSVEGGRWPDQSGGKERRSSHERVPGRGPRRAVALLGLALVAATVVAYAGSLSAAFVLDDRDTILGDPHLGRFDSLSATLLGVRGAPSGGRPLTSLSFHLNALAAGRNPVGYRAVNIAIHALAGLALFGCLRRMLAARDGGREPGNTSAAFAVALLWLVHPLQTEAVTYVSQRAESLMGLFFLLAVYAALRGFEAARPAPWFRLAALASLLGALAKEVGVMAPVVVLLWDSLFVSPGARAAWQRHRRLYAGLALTWAAAALLQLAAPRGYSVSLTNAVLSPLGYLQRQTVGIVTYLKLAVWPSPLVFDYGFPPPAPGLTAAVAAGVVLAGLAVAAVLAARRRLRAGFAGIAFFLILAPSSSVIPVLTEVLAEHRMYLPLACVVATLVGGAVALARRLAGESAARRRAVATFGWALTGAVAVTLGVLTWQRNSVYRTEMSLWRDTVAKVPDNPRAQCNLGMSLLEAGRVDDALTCFRKAVALSPGYFEANGNLAVALERSGRPEEAVPYMRRAVDLNPESGAAWDDLVRLLARLGRWDDALSAARSYVERAPESRAANSLYGSLLSRVGRRTEAQPYLERARKGATGGIGGTSPP